ncbi:MAG TPA: flavin reductase family protein [Herpetosiphonaceae bacterium]
MEIDTREFRRAMGLFATGVTVITAQLGDEVHGMTANAVTSVSLDPLLVLVCIDRRARMASYIVEAGQFGINVLNAEQEHLSRHFAGRRDPNLLVDFGDLNGVPVLPESLTNLACEVERVIDGGDHIVVFGRVIGLESVQEPGEPLLYYAGGYKRLEQEELALAI